MPILKKLNETLEGSYVTGLLLLGVAILTYGVYDTYFVDEPFLRTLLDAITIDGFDWMDGNPIEQAARVTPNITIVRIAFVGLVFLFAFLNLFLVLIALAPLYPVCLLIALFARLTIGRFFDRDDYIFGANMVLIIPFAGLGLIQLALQGFNFFSSMVSGPIVFIASVSLLLILIIIALRWKRDDESKTEVVVEQFTDVVYSDVVEPKVIASFVKGLAEEDPEERFYTTIGFVMGVVFFTLLEIGLLFFNENLLTIGIDYVLFVLVCIFALGVWSNLLHVWAERSGRDRSRSKKGSEEQPAAKPENDRST